MRKMLSLLARLKAFYAAGRAQRSGCLGELTWLLATLDHDHGNRLRLLK